MIFNKHKLKSIMLEEEVKQLLKRVQGEYQRVREQVQLMDSFAEEIDYILSEFNTTYQR